MPAKLKEVFVVQSFWRSPKGWATGQPERFEKEDEARRRATSLKPVYEGVVILAMDIAEGADYVSEPRQIAQLGELPLLE